MWPKKVLACGARYLGSQRNQSAPGLQTVIADQVICFLREGFDPLLGQPVLGEKDVLIIQRIKTHILYIYMKLYVCFTLVKITLWVIFCVYINILLC